jgi:hypothetical protein
MRFVRVDQGRDHFPRCTSTTFFRHDAEGDATPARPRCHPRCRPRALRPGDVVTRLLLCLRGAEGATTRELSQALGVPVRQVSGKLSRYRAWFQGGGGRGQKPLPWRLTAAGRQEAEKLARKE